MSELKCPRPDPCWFDDGKLCPVCERVEENQWRAFLGLSQLPPVTSEDDE